MMKWQAMFLTVVIVFFCVRCDFSVKSQFFIFTNRCPTIDGRHCCIRMVAFGSHWEDCYSAKKLFALTIFILMLW